MNFSTELQKNRGLIILWLTSVESPSKLILDIYFRGGITNVTGFN